MQGLLCKGFHKITGFEFQFVYLYLLTPIASEKFPLFFIGQGFSEILIYLEFFKENFLVIIFI